MASLDHLHQGIFSDIAEKKADGTWAYRALVRGCWTCLVTEKSFPVNDPATGQLVGTVPDFHEADVSAAITAAHDFSEVDKIPPEERLAIMAKAAELVEKHAAVLAEVITRESGKPLSVSKGEVQATAERLKLTMEEVRVLYGEYIPGEWVPDTKGKFAIVLRKPLGVATVISSFNYPLYIAAAKVIPALMAGNSVIAKPSSDTPLALLYFVRILQEAGVPAGAVNIVTGKGSTVGDPIVSSPLVDAVSFTGSTAVGERIASLAGMKKLHLELGGKASAIVLEDADLKLAAAQVCKAAYRNSGQRCDAVSRVFVQRSVKEDFLRLVLEETKKYSCGDPLDPKTSMGTLVNKKAVERVQGLVDEAVKAGAKLLAGGRSKDLFYEPTILDEVPRDSRIAVEEIFGPVIPIIPVDGEAEALQLNNASEYGLDACVFTRNIDTAFRLARAMEDGSVTINAAPAHGVGHFPFGGNKRSGIGREGIKYSIDELTRLHTIIVSSVS